MKQARLLQPLAAVCSHLAEQPERNIGQRRWYKCGGGYGSTVEDERKGHVCKCATISSPQLWRVGSQCGTSCPGYSVPGEKVEPVVTIQPLTVRRKSLTWACALTTVPSRRHTTLPRTLASLAAAGFPAPRLFVDGDSDGVGWVNEFGLDVTARGGAPVRTFGNWVLAAAETYIRNPTADRYAVFQDDFVTLRNLRGYLDTHEFPVNGYWNLYTFPQNAALAGEKKGWYESNQKGLGAVALVFDRINLLRVLQHDHMVGRPVDPSRGHKAVDGGIVTAFRKGGGKEYVHSPTLVQHIGHASSMGNRRHPDAPGFLGEGYDAMGLLEVIA